MNKRGQGTVLLMKKVSELVIGLIVAGILIYSAANVDSLSTFNKVYIEEDIGLISNSMLASPGEIAVKYPIKEGYDLIITEDEIDVTRQYIGFEKKEVTLLYKEEVLTII